MSPRETVFVEECNSINASVSLHAFSRSISSNSASRTVISAGFFSFFGVFLRVPMPKFLISMSALPRITVC